MVNGWRTGARWGKGTVCILIMTAATCVYASVKIHRAVHQREKSPFYCMIIFKNFRSPRMDFSPEDDLSLYFFPELDCI